MASIQKRGSKWYTLHSYKDPVSGKYKRKKFGGAIGETKAQALKRWRRIQAQMEDGEIFLGKKMTVLDLAKEWDKKTFSKKQPTTVRVYRQTLKDHVLPVLGNLDILKVNENHIENMLERTLANRFDGKKSKHTTASAIKTYDVTRAMFNWAKGRKTIPLKYNPMDGVEKPEAPDQTERYLSESEIALMLDLLQGNKWFHSYFFALNIGARRSEILGLRIRDINLDLLTVTIIKKLTYVDGVYYHQNVKKNKNKGQGLRTQSIGVNTALMIRAYLDQRNKERQELGLSPFQLDDLLFTRDIAYTNSHCNDCNMIHSGGFINPDSWGDEWRRRLKGSKLEGLFRPHDLRHTHATHIMAQTGNPKIVQARLGHGDIKTSMGYMHRIPQQDEKAVEKFETMVREAVEKYQSQLDKKIEN